MKGQSSESLGVILDLNLLQIILDMTSFSGVKVHRVARTNKKVLGLLNEKFGFEYVTSPTVFVTRDFVTHFSFTVPEDEGEHRFYTWTDHRFVNYDEC